MASAVQESLQALGIEDNEYAVAAQNIANAGCPEWLKEVDKFDAKRPAQEFALGLSGFTLRVVYGVEVVEYRLTSSYDCVSERTTRTHGVTWEIRAGDGEWVKVSSCLDLRCEMSPHLDNVPLHVQSKLCRAMRATWREGDSGCILVDGSRWSKAWPEACKH
jgi:hypothetical protein